jgi:hypothetical protein
MTMTRFILAVCLVLTPTALGEIVFDGSPGTGSPPATLGGYEMTSFPLDDRPIWDDVTSVPSPLGGELSFSSPMNHRRLGDGWSYVGHGYSGDVYFGVLPSLTLNMPPGTTAFYFYVSSGGFTNFEVTAEDGTTTGPMADKWDLPSSFIGFYATDGDTIGSLTIDASIYEFGLADLGIAVPEPAAWMVFAIGSLATRRRNRR